MALKGLIAAILVYLALLARSAWKQGELPQFLRALGLVVLLGLVLAGAVWGWIWLDRHGLP